MALLAAGLASAQGGPASAAPWWWDAAWWDEGRLPVPSSYGVSTRWDSYASGDADVPVLVARPADDRRYPAVLFQHGRRGLDDLVQLQVRRLAARGLVVAAPDLYSARFVEKFPIEHDYALEQDLARGVDFVLGLPEVSTARACIASHSRGGYLALKVAVTEGRQSSGLACYVSWYPHLQDPNAPEPAQVYRYAPEVDRLTLPVLIFMGEDEQYQRRRNIETAVQALADRGHPARLIVYPGVGRGFDFRSGDVRTFADDLASRDAVERAAAFVREHLDASGR
jgi:carboxymethylenebutenolidase